jgi:outer membrane protein TolC
MKRNIILAFIIFTFQLAIFNLKAQSDSVRITLNKALELALSENPTIRIANRNIEVKKLYQKEQIVPFFPDLNASATYNRTIQKQTMVMDFGGQTTELKVGIDNQWGTGIQATLPLVAPATWYNYKLSQSEVLVAMENARSSKVSLVAEVKKAYYSYLLLKDSYEVLQKMYANKKMNFEDINRKYQYEMASEFDKLRAEVEMKNMQPQINTTKSQLGMAVLLLKVLIGVDMNEPLIFEGSLKEYENEMLSQAIPNAGNLSLNDNTNLRQLDLTMSQLHQSKQLLKAAASPTLGMQFAWQYSALSNDFKFKDYKWHPYSYLAVALQIPIVSWAKTAIQLKEMNLNMQNLQEQKKYVEDNLRTAVMNVVNNLHIALDELNSNKETMLMAEKAYSIAKKAYDVGTATWLDLNSAELAMTSAQLAYNQSIYNYLNAWAGLDETLGK